MVDEHALEHFIEIERFARRVLVVPLQLSRIGIERERRAGKQRGRVAALRPGRTLRLSGPPVHQIQQRIVRPCDPGIGAGALVIRQAAPTVTARRAGARDRVELPGLLARIRIIGGDKAVVADRRLIAACEADDDLAVDHHHAADLVALVLRHADLPHDLSRTRVERIQLRVGRRVEQQISVQRHGACGVQAGRADRADAVLPKEVAAACIERLHGVGHVRRQEHHAVVHERRDLLTGPFVERPGPSQLQETGILRRDLREGAVVPARIVSVVHQPVAVRRMHHHVVGD